MPAKSAHPIASGMASLVKSLLLTARQVMELLVCSRTALCMLMRTQGLPSTKHGDGRCAALRFSLDSVSRQLATREQQRLSA